MSFIIQRLRAIKNLILKRPILLIFNVTRQCNQHCMMCHIPKNTKNMDIEEIKILAEKFKKFGICEVYLQGGEPLLRKDIIEITDIFLNNSIRPTIITNGELLSVELIENIAKRNCNLSVSIDTFNPELYAKLRGKNSLEKVLNTLKQDNLLKLKHKGIFSITSTITKETSLEDLISIFDFCKKIDWCYYVRPYNFNSDKADAKSNDLICDNEKTIKILKYFNNLSTSAASIIYKENIDFLQGKRYNFCDALKYTMVLNEDGQISPCIEHTDVRFSLDDYEKQAKNLRTMISSCNKNTPCIYGCTRNIGFIMKNKLKLLLIYLNS